MSYLPATEAAVLTIGAQIAVARRELGWTAVELADRAGVSTGSVTRVERGAPGTAIGTVFELAILCGVPLFATEPEDMSELPAVERALLAALPTRVRKKVQPVDDDF